MTTEETHTRLDEIRANKGDHEFTHIVDDALREDFIRYVSTLKDPALAEKAKLVLSTNDFIGVRWYS